MCVSLLVCECVCTGLYEEWSCSQIDKKLIILSHKTAQPYRTIYSFLTHL